MKQEWKGVKKMKKEWWENTIKLSSWSVFPIFPAGVAILSIELLATKPASRLGKKRINVRGMSGRRPLVKMRSPGSFVTRLKGSNKISRSQDRPWKGQEATWVASDPNIAIME